jgi:LacI family transcriptional regulator
MFQGSYMPTAESSNLPTVADVARLAGASKATASRALGGYGRVSEKTRANILAAAAELGYTANGLARAMNTGRSDSLGVVSRGVFNPLWQESFLAMTAVTRDAGMTLLFAASDYEVENERLAIELLASKRVDALIVSAVDSDETQHLHAVHNQGMPIVLFERRIPSLDVPVIEAQFEEASSELASLLMRFGHRRVGFVSTLAKPEMRYQLGTGLGVSTIEQRLEGIFNTFARDGLVPSTDLVRLPDRNRAAIREAFLELLSLPDRPTVLIASDSLIAEVMIAVVRERGLRVPVDISLAMYDDPGWATLLEPPMTVISQPNEEMGRAAATLAIASINNADLIVPTFQASLTLRGSVGPNRLREERTG